MQNQAQDQKKPLWDGDKSRKITKRIVIEGELQLQTPAHFGSGDEAGSLMPLILDEFEEKPLLTGASLAGALRSYLWTWERGYGKRQTSQGSAALLFGGAREDDKGDQSRLIVDDAYGQDAKIELRDGVKINPKSRTAEEGKLYTFMVWSQGARFPLRFELIITEDDKDEQGLRQALALALSGLQHGEITLGARKRRGYGRVKVDQWFVREFDLTTPKGLMSWVKEGGAKLDAKTKPTPDLFKALNTSATLPDQRQRFTLQASFGLESSLLIRADSAVADMGHLYSNGKPVLSGTSLAGAIRAHAGKIARTIGIPDAEGLLNCMFGIFGDEADSGDEDDKKARTASRVSIEEHFIEGGETERWVQSRVSIDRFTGGALDTALFDQQPHFGGRVQVNLELRNPQEREIGLLLLVLKDLWTGDLPLGGESSVGRGRLHGQTAKLGYNGKTWQINRSTNGLTISGTKDDLEAYVKTLWEGTRA
jgi:CRISPR/Cas system CSM-associated protein Csm3 (group 7 of RAMP superfamily)